jgi:fructose-1,6-bisphosphatase
MKYESTIEIQYADGTIETVESMDQGVEKVKRFFKNVIKEDNLNKMRTRMLFSEEREEAVLIDNNAVYCECSITPMLKPIG